MEEGLPLLKWPGFHRNFHITRGPNNNPNIYYNPSYGDSPKNNFPKPTLLHLNPKAKPARRAGHEVGCRFGFSAARADDIHQGSLFRIKTRGPAAAAPE